MRTTFFSRQVEETTATNAAQVRSALQDAYDLDVQAFRSETTSYHQTVTSGSAFAVGRARFTGELRGDSRPLPFLCVVQVRSGQQTVTAQNRTHVRADATPFLFPRHTRKHIHWHDTHLEQVILHPAAVDSELRRLHLPALHHIDWISDPNPAGMPLWDAAATYARTATAMPAFTQSPLLEETVFRALVSGLAATFTTAGLPGDRAPGHGTPAAPTTVRRALEFIDAHASEPLTVADIARHVGISSRGLQASFATHLGHSPLHAVRLARLHRAHTDLTHARPDLGDTVTLIAARWGFTNVTRFARHYQALYGQPPTATLHHHH